ncbi:MAG: helix-turn-helix transcriptional regulator [Actinomycetota bacterium]
MSMTTSGDTEFHGYALAKELARLEGVPSPMAQSTLYRALRRLEERGTLQSRWESMEEVAADDRDGPPRRYYTVTATGVAVATAAVVEAERAKLTNPWQTWVPNLIQGA